MKSHTFLTSAAGGFLLLVPLSDALADSVTVRETFANSLQDFAVTFPPVGTPDANDWNYGWYNLTADATPGYQPEDFVQFTAGQVRGTGYGLVPANAPWTFVTAGDNGHPNGTNSLPNQEHWAIRRYTVPATQAGTFDLNYLLVKGNANGNGTSVHVFHNGIELAKQTRNNGFASGTLPVTLNPGDTIDFALTPEGVDALRGDASDGSFWGGSITRNLTLQTIGVVADSVTDFPTGQASPQGFNGWSYGYFDITTNGIPTTTDFFTDFIPFPTDGTMTPSAANFWDGSVFDWRNAAGGVQNPPWTALSSFDGHPNGTNQGAPNNLEHWATRRYSVQAGEEGDYLAELSFSKPNNAGGTAISVMVNGLEIEKWYVNHTVGGSDHLIIPGLTDGDIIDFALTPEGADGSRADGSDTTNFNIRLHLLPEPSSLLLALAGLGLTARRRRRN